MAISETLKFGKKEGVKIAIVPLITDIPIILLTVFILASLSKIDVPVDYEENFELMRKLGQ